MMSKRLRQSVTGVNLARRVDAYLVAFLAITTIFLSMVRPIVARSSILSPQDTAPKIATHKEESFQSLEIGIPVERQMRGGETHSYSITLTAGQFLHAVVDQRGIDVVVTLIAPDGKVVIQVDSPNGTQGPEPLSAIADQSGNYRLNVSSPDQKVQPGRYEIKIEELRTASQQDKHHVAVDLTYAEAGQLRVEGTPESLQKAIARYNEGLKFCQALADSSCESTMLYNIGEAYYRLNNLQKAFEFYNRARLLLQSANNPPILAAVLNGIGTIYIAINDPEKALNFYEQARQIFHQLGDSLDEATILNNIGQIQMSVGNPKEALKHYLDALAILQSYPNHPTLPVLLSNIGYLYLRDQPQKALEYDERALKIFREGNDLPGQAKLLNNIGQVYGAMGRTSAALQSYKQALAIFSQLQDRSNEIIALGNIGTLYELLNRKKEALASYLQAIEKMESVRDSITIEGMRAGLSEEAGFVYKAGLLLMSMRRYVEAFNLSERARARSLLDQLGNVRPDRLQTSNTQLGKEREELKLKLTSLERRREQDDSKLPDAWKDEYAAAQRQYEDLLLRLQLDNPSNASLRNIRTLNLSEVQTHLDKRTTLLSYFFGPEKTFAFVITQNSFHAVAIAVKDRDVIDKIGGLRDFPRLKHLRLATWKQLYSWLIAPISRLIKTPLVGIIPHRELHYLPFSALTSGRHYFGDQHVLFYLPSASVLPVIQRQRKPVGTQMLAMAQGRAARLPRLLHVDDEARGVAKLYDTQPFTTGKALKSEFLKHAGEYSIIHIAAHAETDEPSPLFYRIMLAADQDGTAALELHQVYDLNLAKASLVVLSACDTGLGTHNQGDDIVAFNRAFIYAGTPTVIASLWLVDDASTSELMKSFYIHLKNGMGKAEALRAAQADTRKKYPNPYYWAAFVLTGDPGEGRGYSSR
jgi:CHAT domain-containing protein/tetratricopeptide (TPR) repeat protein